MRKLVWSNSSNSYSDMFPQKNCSQISGETYVAETNVTCQLAAWNVPKKKTSNIFSSDLFEITHKFYSTCGTTAIRTHVSCHYWLAAFPTPEHFKSQPWTQLTQQPSFASTSHSFRIQELGIHISTLHPITLLECNGHNS